MNNQDIQNFGDGLAAVMATMLRQTDGGFPHDVAETLGRTPIRFARSETVAAFARFVYQATEAAVGLRAIGRMAPDPALAAGIAEQHAKQQPVDIFEHRSDLLQSAGTSFVDLVVDVSNARTALDDPRKDTGSRARRLQALAVLRTAPAQLARLLIQEFVPAAQQVGHALTFLDSPGREGVHRNAEHLQRTLNYTLDLLTRASTAVRQMDRATLQAEVRQFGTYWAPFLMVGTTLELLAILIGENAAELDRRLPPTGWSRSYPEVAEKLMGSARSGMDLALANGGAVRWLHFLEGPYRVRAEALNLASSVGLVPARVAARFMPKRW